MEMMYSGVLILIFLVQLANTYVISYFFLYPLAEIIKRQNPRKAFFWLLFMYVFIIALCDLLGVISAIIITLFSIILDFVGSLVIIPYFSRYIVVDNKVEPEKKHQEQISKPTVKITCKKCGELLKVTDSKCPKCGAPFSKENITIEEIKQK